jgi:hypothetical protein
VPYIHPHISKGQLVPLAFGQNDVAASQTAVALTLSNGGDEHIGITMPFDGAIVAVAYTLSVAGSAGVFTIVPTINTTAAVAAYQQTVGTTTKGNLRIQREAVKFVRGDVLGVKITTDGSWNGVTADLDVILYALQYLDAI